MLNFLRIPIRRQKILLLVADGLILFLALPAAVLIRNAGLPEGLQPLAIRHLPSILAGFFRFYTGATTITVGVSLLVFFIFDLYGLERVRTGLKSFLYVAFVCAVDLLAISTVFYIFPNWRLGRGILLLQAALAVPALFLLRALAARRKEKSGRRQRVLIVGGGVAARVLAEELQRNFSSEYEVAGVVAEAEESAEAEAAGLPRLGGRRDVPRVTRETGAGILVFAIPQQTGAVDSELLRDILGLKTGGVEVYEMPTWYKKITGRVPVEVIEDSWLIFNQGFVVSQSGFADRARRVLDIFIALASMILLLPVILLVALAIRLTSRGPVLYSQERLGLNRRAYRMIKFRSMVADAESSGPVWSAGRSDTRVTRLGRFLRRTRLDEIPNFVNVLRGEMSVVGPRPERAHFVEQLEEQIPYYGLRFAVRPGLTGWAQVNYAYGASVEDARRKLQYELYYIQERSLFLDIVILLKTAQTVLLRPGS